MSDLQDIIAKQAILAYNTGLGQGRAEGYREGTRDIFDEVLAALSDLYDRDTISQYQEAICHAQAKVEMLRERYLAQNESK